MKTILKYRGRLALGRRRQYESILQVHDGRVRNSTIDDCQQLRYLEEFKEVRIIHHHQTKDAALSGSQQTFFTHIAHNRFLRPIHRLASGLDKRGVEHLFDKRESLGPQAIKNVCRLLTICRNDKTPRKLIRESVNFLTLLRAGANPNLLIGAVEIVLAESYREIAEESFQLVRDLVPRTESAINAAVPQATRILCDLIVPVPPIHGAFQDIRVYLCQREDETSARSQYPRNLSQVVRKSLIRFDIVATVACQDEIKGSIIKGKVRVRAFLKLNGNTESRHSISRQIADFVGDLDTVDFETQVVQERHIAPVTKPEVKDLGAAIGSVVNLEIRVCSQKSPHNEFNWIDLRRVLLGIEVGVLVFHR